MLFINVYNCRDMVNIYKQNEVMWQKLAKIQLKGFIYNFKSEYVYHCKDDLNCIRLNILKIAQYLVLIFIYFLVIVLILMRKD